MTEYEKDAEKRAIVLAQQVSDIFVPFYIEKIIRDCPSLAVRAGRYHQKPVHLYGSIRKTPVESLGVTILPQSPQRVKAQAVKMLINTMRKLNLTGEHNAD